MAKASQNEKRKELIISRIFDAPRELVWKVWTVPGAGHAMVGTGRIHGPGCKDRSPCWGKISLCNAIS